MDNQNQLKNAYNKQANQRNEAITETWKIKERNHFLKLVQEEEKVTLLEIGTGPGNDSLYFKENGLKTFSTDLSPEMITLCKEKGLEAAEMSFYDLTFPSNHFDAIYALNCLLHVPKAELEDVLIELKRVLQPGGLFYLGVYGGKNSEGIWEDDVYEPKRFFSFYEDDALQTLLTAHFSIESFTVVPKHVIGGELTFQSVILRKIEI
ncbi:class I SAM-dependent methyltransferase [Bacillus sp. Marseille-P3800]|uniref:class I SAM-dependent methyltransferase n=1 Tax=Bacillus sp. Marseille-P3800 TaxID=2014782 RepID=UPI0021004DF2|nr:class I SAM-dependent methyltransferase [Bacillus sp. Marseille-P3800]